jgi:hypothetical protein
MVTGGVGKDVRGGDGVVGPDDLTGPEVPPHVRIVEARPRREDSENNQKAGQHCREGENCLQ